MKSRLQLEISIDRCDSFDGMEQTYRDEGLSVGPEQLRIQGNDVPLPVGHNDLIIGSTIGQGSCSNVNIAVHRTTGVKYAVKMFNIYDHRQAEQLKKEGKILFNLFMFVRKIYYIYHKISVNANKIGSM